MTSLFHIKLFSSNFRSPTNNIIALLLHNVQLREEQSENRGSGELDSKKYKLVVETLIGFNDSIWCEQVLYANIREQGK